MYIFSSFIQTKKVQDFLLLFIIKKQLFPNKNWTSNSLYYGDKKTDENHFFVPFKML